MMFLVFAGYLEKLLPAGRKRGFSQAVRPRMGTVALRLPTDTCASDLSKVALL
jgi:hypothetical protein